MKPTSPTDAEYNEACTKMFRVAAHWIIQHPGARPEFNPPPAWVLKAAPKGTPPEKVFISAALVDCMEWWPANDDARTLLKLMSDAVPGYPSYAMAKAVVERLDHAGGPPKRLA